MSDYAIIRCSRCADLPVPHAPSQRGRCDQCGARVWCSTSLLAVTQRRCDDVRLRCLECGGTDEEDRQVQMRLLPEQVADLRQSGLSDDEIAYAFAVAEVAGVKGDLGETAAEINVGWPDGLKAKAFQKALNKALISVALTRAPHN